MYGYGDGLMSPKNARIAKVVLETVSRSEYRFAAHTSSSEWGLKQFEKETQDVMDLLKEVKKIDPKLVSE